MSGVRWPSAPGSSPGLGWSMSVSFQHQDPGVWPGWPAWECVMGLPSSSSFLLKQMWDRCWGNHWDPSSIAARFCSSSPGIAQHSALAAPVHSPAAVHPMVYKYHRLPWINNENSCCRGTAMFIHGVLFSSSTQCRLLSSFDPFWNTGFQSLGCLCVTVTLLMLFWSWNI